MFEVDLEQYVLVYSDDVKIYTSMFDKHMEVLEEVLCRIKAAGLNGLVFSVHSEKIETIPRIPSPLGCVRD